MTKFECAQEIVKTLTPDQILKLAAKQVVRMMKVTHVYQHLQGKCAQMIDNALTSIHRMDRTQLDFTQAWDDHKNKI